MRSSIPNDEKVDESKSFNMELKGTLSSPLPDFKSFLRFTVNDEEDPTTLQDESLEKTSRAKISRHQSFFE